ncbi:hypothetical protein Plo01_00710 [Planobispora longispora]|uniref:DUF2092 domain-containing protein n=1 Tax=Planobispora longispora TaxID=28887 RepID=A0A8J3RDC1_9ACTN|nr:outer membrane lipoprotein carrier protein LolA [Planobispora longispora]GIH73642.1 hypothetical protein Plo01_00710 [Planobispora longispora]
MPVAAVAVVAGAIGAGPVIAAVQGDPVLPERTAGQLLADALKAAESGPRPMSGTVLQTASLGVPGLPQVSGMGGTSPATLLTGSHELKVWYGGETKFRLALPGRMSETDLIVNGDQAWLWESDSSTATRIKGSVKTEDAPDHPEALPTATTPQQIAEEVLRQADADTAVGVSSSEKVAGRDAYQLTLAPKDASSLVKEVKLALDGETFVPLRVQVYAKSAAEPAFEVGFTSVSFTPPAAENFTFTPPAGATVKEQSLDELAKDAKAGMEARQEENAELADGMRTVGKGWTTVAVIPFSEEDLKAQTQGQGQGQGQGQDGQEARPGETTALADALLESAAPVSGPWGSGKVIRTKLVSALLTDDGRLLVGAVTPEKLVEVAGR